MQYQLLLILATLWLTDLYQTLSQTKKCGIKTEKNPIARLLIKQSPSEFILFKIIDLAFLSAIFLTALSAQKTLSNILLISFNLIYAFTVIHNHHIIKRHSRATKNTRTQ